MFDFYKYSWIASTKQIWKVIIFTFGILICIGVWIHAAFFMGERYYFEIPLPPIIVAVIIGFFSFTWLILSIRCPFCNKKIVWWLLNSKFSFDWPIVLFLLKSCLICEKNFPKNSIDS